VALVVQKFGGTSVADPERLKAVARRLVAAREDGNRVVGVLSAMGKVTDELIDLAGQVSPLPDARELDMLISVGERISCALAAMAIIDQEQRAISLTGSQAGIVTDTAHGKAKIVDVRAMRIHEALDAGRIVLVAGFQGVSTDFDITTLGRGGSDTTAVALAAALGAEVCEVYTDVGGVMTADPRVVPDARVIERIGYDDMLELAAAGAKVLQSRSVEVARRAGLRLHVRSSFDDDAPGTWVQEVDDDMEDVLISGVALETDEAKVTFDGVPDKPGVAASLFKAVAGVGVSVDMIVQNVSHEGATDLSFTAPLADVSELEAALGGIADQVGARTWSIDDGVAKVSLVGAGMKSQPGVAADMFDALAEEGINIEMISTSPIRISCVVRKEDADRAMRAVHARFGLDVPAQMSDN
jgi:aspartate kinase